MRRVVVRVLVNLTAARPVTRGKPQRIPPGPLVCCLVVSLDLSRHRTGELMTPMTLKVVDFSGDRAECRNLAGNVVRLVGLPTAELIESLAWKDDETLILWEIAKTRNLPEINLGPAWVVSLTGAPRPAGPGEAQPFYPAGSLSMPHGRSPRYRVEERWWRGSSGKYLDEINVMPVRRDQNLMD
ncbi:MAG: hypothetical protein HPY55_13905 [Firmicutes bacterium]|nr:hypothetical protein [Bacillota bacterium]